MVGSVVGSVGSADQLNGLLSFTVPTVKDIHVSLCGRFLFFLYENTFLSLSSPVPMGH